MGLVGFRPAFDTSQLLLRSPGTGNDLVCCGHTALTFPQFFRNEKENPICCFHKHDRSRRATNALTHSHSVTHTHTHAYTDDGNHIIAFCKIFPPFVALTLTAKIDNLELAGTLFVLSIGAPEIGPSFETAFVRETSL